MFLAYLVARIVNGGNRVKASVLSPLVSTFQCLSMNKKCQKQCIFICFLNRYPGSQRRYTSAAFLSGLQRFPSIRAQSFQVTCSFLRRDPRDLYRYRITFWMPKLCERRMSDHSFSHSNSTAKISS